MNITIRLGEELFSANIPTAVLKRAETISVCPPNILVYNEAQGVQRFPLAAVEETHTAYRTILTITL